MTFPAGRFGSVEKSIDESIDFDRGELATMIVATPAVIAAGLALGAYVGVSMIRDRVKKGVSAYRDLRDGQYGEW